MYKTTTTPFGKSYTNRQISHRFVHMAVVVSYQVPTSNLGSGLVPG